MSYIFCRFDYCFLPLQAYGAGNYKRVSVILQRSVLVCSLSLFPVAVIFLNAESILLILHQSPCVARYTYVPCISTLYVFVVCACMKCAHVYMLTNSVAFLCT